MNDKLKQLLLCALIGAIFGALVATVVIDFVPKSNNQLISEFYTTEHASSVSPSDYIADLNNGKIDGIVVDLRTTEDYDAGHLVTAINIPAGEMNESQIVAAYSKLPKNTTIINYCYSEYCMLSVNVGKALVDNEIYTEHMTAGFYEINRDFPSYIVNGSSPGSWDSSTNSTSDCTATVSGGFSC